MDADPAASPSTQGHVQAAAAIWRPTEESIIANAESACEEARRHIDAQAKDAEALDTKAAALLTLTSGAFGLAAGHVHVASPVGLVSGTLTVVYFVLVAAACFLAIRPRDGFSYGAYPSFLAGLTDYPHWSVMKRLAESLGNARESNVAWLATKQRWYERAITTVPFVAIGVAWMAAAGAIV